MLERLPLILEQFHCEEYELEKQMKEVGLFDLTLKFDENKKSLERFVDNEKFEFRENDEAENEADRTRNAERNGENHRYFQAVRKLFCKKADEITENADLVFETDNQNQLKITSSQSIQHEFRLKLNNLTQEAKGNVKSCVDKKTIIENLIKMEDMAREHFLFFCGDWICHSSKFLSKDDFLIEYENIVKKRINFACKNQNNPNNKLELTNEAYNLLTAVTLISGLATAKQLKEVKLEKVKQDIIDEICFLITGKKKDFSLDDVQLIMRVAKCFGNTAQSILDHAIKNQDYKHAFTFIRALDPASDLSHDGKIKFIECIGNRYQEFDLMSVISDIDKFNVYPDYGNDDYDYFKFGCGKKKLSFKFMQKLMDQLLQKYEYGVYPDADQKAILGRSLAKFVVDNNEFDKNKQAISDFFTKLMNKVPTEKSKDVIKEIIRICSNLREKNQRATILKCVLDASNNSLKGLELLEVLGQYNYARGSGEYCAMGLIRMTPIEFDDNLIDKLISDIIKKPLPLTKKEVQRLEWFCENSKPKNLKFSDHQVNVFLQLIQKMPEGSMSTKMLLNLITKFFPALSQQIKYNAQGEWWTQIYTVINLNRLNSYQDEIMKNLAYALPLCGLNKIVSLPSWANPEDPNYDYDYHYALDRERYSTLEYQKNAKEEQKYKKIQEEKAEKEEAKKERAKKIITVINKLDEKKIEQRRILAKWKQINKSKKEKEKQDNSINENKNDNNINEKNDNKKKIQTEEKKEKQGNGVNENKNDNNINEKKEKNINIIINVPISDNPSNPYTLSAWLGFLPVIPSIIFGVKIYNEQHKLTGGDIVLIIVGIFPIISAIVFGIMAYRRNQNNLAKKTQQDLKYAGNINENDNNIEEKEKENENDKGEKINLFSLIDNSNQHQYQNQENKK